MPNKLVIANFKSNKNLHEMQSWLDEFLEIENWKLNIVLCPPTPFLPIVSAAVKQTKLKLGVQDVSPFPAGAYTGAVGTKNLEGLRVSYAIVGHSERRRYFHETNADVANKVHEALTTGIIPIVCVTRDTVISQANSLEDADRKRVIVAFEPIENIGTGITDTLSDILDTRELVAKSFGNVPYVYGGSVDAKTDSAILKHEKIDGFLVGSASLQVDAFCTLLRHIA